MDIKSNARKQNLIISQYPKVLLFNIYFCLFIRWSLTDNGFCSTINVITMFCSLIYIKLSPDWSPKLLFRLKLLKCHGIHSRPFKASLIAYVCQIVLREQTWVSSNLTQRWKPAHLMTKSNKHRTNMDILGLARAIADLFICPIHVSWWYHQPHETNTCRVSGLASPICSFPSFWTSSC